MNKNTKKRSDDLFVAFFGAKVKFLAPLGKALKCEDVVFDLE